MTDCCRIQSLGI